MNRSVIYAFAVGLLMLPGGTAWADVTATVTSELGLSSITVVPGSSFSVLVKLTTTDNLISGQAKIRASDPDIFSLTSVFFDGVVWSDNPDDLLDPTPQALDGGNANTSDDIGTLARGHTGTGGLTLVKIGVVMAGTAQVGQVYTLDIADSIFGLWPSYDEVGAIAGPPLEILAVPAPGGVLLGLLGLGLIARLKRWLA